MKISTVSSFISISLLFLMACSSNQQVQKTEFEESYFCNVEKLDAQKRLFNEISGKDIGFQNVESRSDEFSFSGRFSSKLFLGNPCGLTSYISDIHADDYLQLTAWRRGNNDSSALVVESGA